MKFGLGMDALSYTYKQLRGHLFAFIFGLSAANLVSMFFETRSIKNLWGLTARRTVVSKGTFRFLEWTCSLVIGFIAFEVANKLMQKTLNMYLGRIKLFVHKKGAPPSVPTM